MLSIAELRPFVSATGITIGVLTASILGGVVLCTISTFTYLAGGRAARFFVPLLLSVFRNVPIVIFLIFSQFVLPILFGLFMPALYNAVLVISLVIAAYTFDIVRGYIHGFDLQQVDAARVLGFSRRQIILAIVAPQFFLNQRENLFSIGLIGLKATAIASIVSVQEITHTANRIISQTAQSTIPIFVSTSLYIVIGLLLYAVAGLMWRQQRPHD